MCTKSSQHRLSGPDTYALTLKITVCQWCRCVCCVWCVVVVIVVVGCGCGRGVVC